MKSRVNLKGPMPSAVVALLMPLGLFGQLRSADAAKNPDPVKQEAPKTNPASTDPLTGTGLSVDTKTYVIGPEDILFISVWREDTLTRQYGVRPDGKITVPLIKDVQAAGLTPERLGDQLTQALGEYFTKPEITVTVIQVNSKKFFITGEVNRGGQYPLATPITIFDALNGAGGFRDFANKKNITIVRGPRRIRFNYEEVRKGKKLEQNIFVENGDTIIVN